MAKKSTETSITSTPNYGDVALRLPPDWSRSSLASGQEFMRTTVGHENGVADLYLKDDPGKKHQFQWCDPKDIDRRDFLRSEGYIEVKGRDNDGPWIKNELLWEWDAEGFVWFKGQRAWARSEERWIASEKAKEQQANMIKKRRDETDAAMLKALGDKALDDRGRPLAAGARG